MPLTAAGLQAPKNSAKQKASYKPGVVRLGGPALQNRAILRDRSRQSLLHIIEPMPDEIIGVPAPTLLYGLKISAKVLAFVPKLESMRVVQVCRSTFSGPR